MKVFQELSTRGLVKQTTSDEVATLLNGEPITFYCGFDPTADSLHIGSLLPLIMIKRLQNAGHKAIVLLGNATASIGDPSGKSAERVMLNQAVIDHNLQSIKNQISTIVGDKTLFVENLDWFKKMSFIDFLRDVGKNFSVNNMLNKDSVKSRLENRDQGISFTEFSYMLLQAEDFRHLFVNHECILEVGGSDQWSHVLSGIDLIKTTTQKQAFGMTFPLITKSDGTKFGKTEKGNIWLSADKTSVFDFFQFFINVSDEDIIKLLDFLSLKSLTEIEELKSNLKTHPELRLAQKSLAEELTLLVHGEVGLKEALQKTNNLFAQKNIKESSPDFSLPESEVIGVKLIDLLVKTGLSSSKGMARKDIAGNGIKLNQVKVVDIDLAISTSNLEEGKLLLSKGKSNHKIIEVI